MKIKTIIILAAIFAICTACANEPNNANTKTTNGSTTPGLTPTDYITEPPQPTDIPMLPEISRAELDDIYNSLMSHPMEELIPLEYEILRPMDGYFAAMDAMSHEEYLQLRDQRNFLVANEFALYLSYDTSDSLYKIVIEHQDGESEIVFSSTRVIKNMRFFDRTSLVVELVEYQYYEGQGARLFALDLKEEALTPLYDRQLVDSSFCTYFWYDGHLIVTGDDVGPALGVASLNLVLENGEAMLLAQGANAEPYMVKFDSGRMYYTLYEEEQNSTLFAVDLVTYEQETIFEFEQSYPNLFHIEDGLLYVEHGAYPISDETGGIYFKYSPYITVYDIENGESVVLELAEKYKLASASYIGTTDIFWTDTSSEMLWKTTSEGKSEALLSNFAPYEFTIWNDVAYIYMNGIGYMWKGGLNSNTAIIERIF